MSKNKSLMHFNICTIFNVMHLYSMRTELIHFFIIYVSMYICKHTHTVIQSNSVSIQCGMAMISPCLSSFLNINYLCKQYNVKCYQKIQLKLNLLNHFCLKDLIMFDDFTFCLFLLHAASWSCFLNILCIIGSMCQTPVISPWYTEPNSLTIHILFH